MPKPLPSGLRTVRSDWGNDSIYARRRKPAAPPPPTPEQIASREKFWSDYEERLKRDDEAWLARRAKGAATVVDMVDQDARIAVEGDPAMDDVPFGESGE